MGNVISYLKWRGDLNFRERSFCEADNLALAMLSYENLNGIVPELGTGIGISVRDTFEKYTEKEAESVLKYMAQSKRFADAILSDYCVIYDVKTQTQFGAMCITLDSKEKYISFRGTDNSIIGWKEDFCIAFEVVRSQKEAVRYLEQVIRQDETYYIGGHSKGGNLAVYASMYCAKEQQDRIVRIFCNDGPGICTEMMDLDKYERIQSKIIKFVPQFCIIGRLFELPVETIMVESDANGFLQHDGITWQIEGDHFRYKEQSPANCETYNRIFDEWIESADFKQRKSFTNDFFGALLEHGRTTIDEVAESGIDGYGTILLSIAESKSQTKIAIGKFLKSCCNQMKKFNGKDFIRTKAGVKSVLCVLLGIAFVLFRENAVRWVGISLLLGTWIWSGKKLLEAALGEAPSPEQKKRRVILYMLLMCIAVFAFSHYMLILVYANIVIGCFLCYFSIVLLRKAADKSKKRIERIGNLFVSGMFFMFGIASLATPSSSFWGKIILMGSLLILYGISEMLKAIFIEEKSYGRKSS